MSTSQYTTFSLGDYHYAIDVMKVQEVTNEMQITQIPLAPNYVKGLINLRGQIATAIGLNELFDVHQNKKTSHCMTVVCKVDGHLISLIVDSIGEVIELAETNFEPTPDTIQGQIKKFMSGVYKTEDKILSIIDLEKLNFELNKTLNINE